MAMTVERFNMTRLGGAYVAERLYLAEVGDDLIVGRPSAVLIVERLAERVDFGIRQGND